MVAKYFPSLPHHPVSFWRVARSLCFPSFLLPSIPSCNFLLLGPSRSHSRHFFLSSLRRATTSSLPSSFSHLLLISLTPPSYNFSHLSSHYSLLQVTTVISFSFPVCSTQPLPPQTTPSTTLVLESANMDCVLQLEFVGFQMIMTMWISVRKEASSRFASHAWCFFVLDHIVVHLFWNMLPS